MRLREVRCHGPGPLKTMELLHHLRTKCDPRPYRRENKFLCCLSHSCLGSLCYSSQAYNIRHCQGSPNTPTIEIKTVGVLWKCSSEASTILRFQSPVATALLPPACLQAARGQALLRHAGCQLPPCHEVSTYISGRRANWTARGALSQSRPMETSGPDFRLGPPAPCGWGQPRRIQGQMHPGAAGNERL